MIRKIFLLFPPSTRVYLRTVLRNIRDVKVGMRSRLVKRDAGKIALPVQRTISQRVCPTATLQAKLHNINKAIACLNGLEIGAGKIISFWQVVGKAGKRQGFSLGSNIINGKLSHDYGGGLCQLASIIYELSLRCGLEIVERHAHSTNIYTPETTYTTLGLDATVAYGYKDLRIGNPYPFTCHFSFELSTTRLTAHLCAAQPFPSIDLRVFHFDEKDGLNATVHRQKNGKWIEITSDFYQALEQ